MVCKKCNSKTFYFDRTIWTYKDKNGNLIQDGPNYFCSNCGEKYNENKKDKNKN